MFSLDVVLRVKDVARFLLTKQAEHFKTTRCQATKIASQKGKKTI